MTAFNWISGALNLPGSWGPQPNPAIPVTPGVNDAITVTGAGNIIGAVTANNATLNGVFNLQGSITSVNGTTVNGVVTLNAAASALGAGAIFVESAGGILQQNGAVTAASLQVGWGVYDLSAGALNVGSSNEYIGVGINGAFNQTGGTNTISGSLQVASQGGVGAYTMNAGALNCQSEYIGANGKGTFTQSGGVVHDTGRVVLGINVNNGANGKGIYTLNGVGSLSSATIFDGSDHGSTGKFDFNVGGGGATLSITPTINFPGLDIGGDGTGTFNQGNGAISTSVSLGFHSDGNGTYNLLNGTLSSTDERIGDEGTGVFNQNNGTNITTGAPLRIGAQMGSTGTYNLNVGKVKASALIDGDDGAGRFNQLGGQVKVTAGDLVVGNLSSGAGTYNLQAGPLDIVAGRLTLAAQAQSAGTFILNGGQLTVGAQLIDVGDGGDGIFNQMLGAVDDGLDIGVQTGSTGQYNLLGGAITVTSDDEIVGDAGEGVFNQMVSTNTINVGSLLIGDAGGSGTYNLGGTGALAITAGKLQLGVGGGSTGTFNFNLVPNAAATLTIDSQTIQVGVHGGGNFFMGGGALNAKLVVGAQVGSLGIVQLSGGAINALGQVVGNNGGGIFNQLNGQNAINGGGDLILGSFAAGGGTYNLNGGQLSAGSELDGYAGKGAFFETAGSNILAAPNSILDLGVQTGSVGAYTLSGGSLAVVQETIGDAGHGTFTQTGGVETISGNLTIGNASGGQGALALSGGQITFSSATALITLGAQSGSTGSLNLSNEKLSVNKLVDGSSGLGSVVVGAGGVLKVATSVVMHGASKLNSLLGAVRIGAGVDRVDGTIGVGVGGALRGAGTVSGAIVEIAGGSVDANGGTLRIKGAVSGGGELSIESGAELELGGADVNKVSFMGPDATLRLDALSGFTGHMVNLQLGDVIDLGGLKATHADIVANMLNVTYANSTTQAFHIAGALDRQRVWDFDQHSRRRQPHAGENRCPAVICFIWRSGRFERQRRSHGRLWLHDELRRPLLVGDAAGL